GIQIDQGELSFEGSSAVNGSGTITVNPGASLVHFRLWGGSITRPITLNGGTLTNRSSGGGNSTNDAPITLTADSVIGVTNGSDLYINGPISQSGGSFGFTKNINGTVILSGAATYSGNVIINAGTVQFGTNT